MTNQKIPTDKLYITTAHPSRNEPDANLTVTPHLTQRMTAARVVKTSVAATTVFLKISLTWTINLHKHYIQYISQNRFNKLVQHQNIGTFRKIGDKMSDSITIHLPRYLY